MASRLDRQRKKGGGVAIYCRSDLSFSKLTGPSLPASSRLELIWINVQCGHNRSLVHGCVYRPPTYEGIKADLEALEISVQKLLSEGRQVILCGDLNCDLLRPNLAHVRPLLSLLNQRPPGGADPTPPRFFVNNFRFVTDIDAKLRIPF